MFLLIVILICIFLSYYIRLNIIVNRLDATRRTSRIEDNQRIRRRESDISYSNRTSRMGSIASANYSIDPRTTKIGNSSPNIAYKVSVDDRRFSDMSSVREMSSLQHQNPTHASTSTTASVDNTRKPRSIFDQQSNYNGNRNNVEKYTPSIPMKGS